MKHLTLMVLVIIFSSCQSIQTKDKILKLSGEITGVGDKIMKVMQITSTDIKILDTLEIKDEKFTFSKKLDEPTRIIIADDSGRKQVAFFVDNATYTMKGSYNHLRKATITTQDPQAKKMIEICQKAKDIRASSFQRRKQVKELLKALNQATSKGDTLKIKELREKYIAEKSKRKEYREQYLNLIKIHSTSAAAAFIACSPKYYDPKNLEERKKVYAILDTSLNATSSYYRELGARIKNEETFAVGHKVPNFTSNNTEGKAVSLSSIKAKVLLVDFWASWCAPCRRENPNVVKVYKEFHDKGFDVLGVSLDDKKDNWLKAIKDDSLVWHHVSDLKGWKNAVAQLYGIRAVPTNYLLDENGVILAKNLRGDILEQKVTELLGQDN